MKAIEAPTLDQIRAAWERIAGIALRTPLVRLELPDVAGAPAAIYLKLECLQPVGSFKIRGALNTLLLAGTDAIACCQSARNCAGDCPSSEASGSSSAAGNPETVTQASSGKRASSGNSSLE